MQSPGAPTTIALSSMKIGVPPLMKQHPPLGLLFLLHDVHLVAHGSLMCGIHLPVAQYLLFLQDQW